MTMFFQLLALQAKLATLPLGAVFKFGTFQIVIGDMPGQLKRSLICVSRFADQATICFSAGGGESVVLASTGNWEDFYTGEEVYLMLCQFVQDEEGPSKDEMIEPLVSAICRLPLSTEIRQEYRYGFDRTCRWKISETPGRDEKNIHFTLVRQSPGSEEPEERRTVSFSITFKDSTPSVKLVPSGALINVSRGPKPPFLAVGEQLELALQIGKLY